MPRRGAAQILPLAGMLILLGGLVALHGVFRQERREARRALDSEQEFLRLRAASELGLALEGALRDSEAARERAREDPCAPGEGVLWWRSGRQLLPRVFERGVNRAPDRPPAERLYRDLRAARPGTAEEGESPWDERRALLAGFREALAGGDSRQVEAAFLSLLEHRVAYRIDGVLDLVSSLVLMEVFERDGDPHPDLFRRLLVEGVSDGRGGRLEPLGAQLLSLRPRLDRDDFDFLLARMGDRADAASVDLAAVRERAREEEGRPLPFDPAGVEAPQALWDAGRWFVEAGAGAEWVGVRVDLPALAREVARKLRRAAAGAADLELSVVPPAEGQALEELQVGVSSAGWQRRAGRIDERHRWKSGLLGLTALLGMVVAGLSFGHQRRRDRLLRLQTDFVAAVSHELKTPLASVRLMAETLERKLGPAPGARDYPRRMIQAVDGLHFLVDNILSFHRLGSGRGELQRRAVDLRDALSSAEEHLGERLARPIDLHLDAAERAQLQADPALLELVLVNLLRNAALYNEHERAKITVQHRRRAGRDVLRVIDDGWGLREDQAERAFERFWRGADPSRPRVAGTGLGLAICRLVMELHGGSIVLESTSAQGSVFRLELPALDREDSPPDPEGAR